MTTHILVQHTRVGKVALISTTGDEMASILPGKGAWLGEVYDPNLGVSAGGADTAAEEYWQQDHRRKVSWRCVSDTKCKTLTLFRESLHGILSSNPRMAEA